MNRYEIINPSDKVIVSCDDDTVAAAVVLLLGRGRYGLRRCDGSDNKQVTLPIFLMGGSDEWLEAKGILDFGVYLDDHKDQAIACLESAFYGDLAELEALDAALSLLDSTSRFAAMQRYNDRKRNSMNDIGAACREIAQMLRERHISKTKQEAAGG